MPALNDVAARHTDLTDADLDRLHLLLADWQLLADLSFSDLVLWLPTWNGSGYVVGGQMRPTTGATVFADDLVGTFLPKGRRPAIDEAVEVGRVTRGGSDHALVPAEAIPVRGPAGGVVAVVARHTDPATARPRGRLESAYVEIGDQLARMLADGSFPLPGGLEGLDASPRVGDGLLRLDADGRVAYASPNALSAYRRLGLAADLVGVSLAEVTRQLLPRRGPVDEDLSAVAGGRSARGLEVEGKGSSLLLRSIPLLEAGRRTGALLLVRDVSELRRRERELLTKEATIREIHHRVKNNLQTVAALLRLQARRTDQPQARDALEEAVRRVGSIALVHELLSTAPDESVLFDAVADRVLAEVAALAGAESSARPVRRGTFGVISAEVATPLVVAVSELVQNAFEHGLAGRGGSIEVLAARVDDGLRVEVVDDGAGLPPGFEERASDRLGLQIVRTLVESELSGRLRLERRDQGGTRAVIDVPMAP